MNDLVSRYRILAITAAAVVSACSNNSSTSPTPAPTNTLSFFVTSATNPTGNLGGLRGADALCQTLATAVGAGSKSWRAYLSVEHDADNNATNARARIGNGPWVNAAGVTVAANLNDLHARRGDASVFVDERGQRINGQWTGSPAPVQHDILTGSAADGSLMPGFTCADWTSSSASIAAQVGHADGFGPNQDTSGSLSSWNSAHASASCADTAPRGGAGRIYCFA